VEADDPLEEESTEPAAEELVEDVVGNSVRSQTVI